MKHIFSRWREAGATRLELDVLMHIDPKESLRLRLNWLIELLQWTRSPGTTTLPGLDASSGHLQAVRVRYFLQFLERNPEWKLNVARTLRSIVRDTRALDLFSTVGLPSESGLFSEAAERVMMRLLPQPPREADLAEIFTELFPSPNDAQWLSRLEPSLVADLRRLFEYEVSDKEANWNSFNRDMEDALLLLATQVQSIGQESQIRTRLSVKTFRNQSFFKISIAAHDFVSALHHSESSRLKDAHAEFERVIGECFSGLNDVSTHLNEYGVSIGLVYRLDRISTTLMRMEVLASLLSGSAPDLFPFLISLVRENAQKRSLSALFAENFSLLSRKIAERSAETGHHYIARNPREYRNLFGAAAGGGAITTFTVLIKIAIAQMHIAYFFKGLWASLNYSASFLGLQYFGFTLATKQPAMTATALADKMKNLEGEESIKDLVTEIRLLIRSQAVSVFGNLVTVVPGVIIVGLGYEYLRGGPWLSPDIATELLNDHGLLGPTPIYAAVTGVLLWLSSIIAGWVDNWSAYRQLPEAIAHSRQLRYFVGESHAQKFGNFFKKHISGVAANVSLGFLLGMSPKVAQFFGLPLDVRHVTLSSGIVALAAVSLPIQTTIHSLLPWAIAGLLCAGVLNIGVSFGLAMFVALRARQVRSPKRNLIYREIFRDFSRQPLAYLMPSKARVEGSDEKI